MIGKEVTQDLVAFSFQIINKTLFELSQKRSETDRKVYANMLADDLTKRYYNLTREEVALAFAKGVREKDELAVNPRSWNIWLREAKLKSNSFRLQQMKEKNQLQLEHKKSPEELKKIFDEFVEYCILQPYEEYCKTKSFRISGISIVYKYLENKKLIILSAEYKKRLFEEMQKSIIYKKKFHNKQFENYDAATMCREKVLKDKFWEWRNKKFDLRKELTT
tara:strand:+ start:364 stop:1026 length:663 start_codon:yes stop_codon:yes gene_type:complete